MKTKIPILAAIFGLVVTSQASDRNYRHAEEDSHHAYHDRAAANRASEHARESYERAIHFSSHGDYYNAVRDFAHAARDAHAAQHSRNHSRTSSHHAQESYGGHGRH